MRRLSAVRADVRDAVAVRQAQIEVGERDPARRVLQVPAADEQPPVELGVDGPV